jgi:AraC-like DNA-binding protein
MSAASSQSVFDPSVFYSQASKNGILEQSQLYFLTPTQYAKQFLYYLDHIGMYSCDSRYAATHEYLEAILILFIDSGELEVAYEKETFLARGNDIVLIDCRKQHGIHCNGDCQFRFFLFSGLNSHEYVNLIHAKNHSACIANGVNLIAPSIFQSLFRLAQSQGTQKTEHRISVYLHMLLGELIEATMENYTVSNASITQAIQYMNEHLHEAFSLDELAQYVNLSKYYFIRCFRQVTGLTPHQYFINLRIQYAKQLLITTNSSIEQIAERLGFSSSSNFIRTFKQQTGATPREFRSHPVDSLSF